MLFWQVAVNIGMVTGLLPVVGVTLPLISYGGSSALTVMLALGLVMNVSVRRFAY
jgi:rod shape determining protein RodA